MPDNGTWKTSGTSTRILWGVTIISVALTIATWICAVPFEMQSVQQSLAGIVTLILAPQGLAITQYQLSKHLNQRHARSLNGNGHGVPEIPKAPEPPRAPGK